MTKQASPITPDDREKLRAGAAKRLPHAPSISLIGLHVEKIAPDDVTLRLPCREDLTNDRISYHGAAIASAVDTWGRAGSLVEPRLLQANSRVDRSAFDPECQRLQADLICRSTTVRRKRELTFVDIVGEDEDGTVLTKAFL